MQKCFFLFNFLIAFSFATSPVEGLIADAMEQILERDFLVVVEKLAELPPSSTSEIARHPDTPAIVKRLMMINSSSITRAEGTRNIAFREKAYAMKLRIERLLPAIGSWVPLDYSHSIERSEKQILSEGIFRTIARNDDASSSVLSTALRALSQCPSAFEEGTLEILLELPLRSDLSLEARQHLAFLMKRHLPAMFQQVVQLSDETFLRHCASAVSYLRRRQHGR